MKLSALSLSALIFASCAYEEPPLYEAFLDPKFKLPAQTQTVAQTPNPTATGSGSGSFTGKPTVTGSRTASPSTGLRAPGDMLNLPQDDQLKSSPSATSKDGNATLIARPPEQ